MNLKKVFLLARQILGPGIKYIKALDNGTYEVREFKRNTNFIYFIKVKGEEIEILNETQDQP